MGAALGVGEPDVDGLLLAVGTHAQRAQHGACPGLGLEHHAIEDQHAADARKWPAMERRYCGIELLDSGVDRGRADRASENR